MLNQLKKLRQLVFDRNAEITLVILAFLIPIKLSLLYITLIPSMLIWLSDFKEVQSVLNNKKLRFLFSPLLAFFLISLICSLWGINSLNSTKEILEAVFFAFSIPMFFDLIKKSNKLISLYSLLLGQGIASCHTLFERASQLEIPKLFIGQLTEAGQLSISMLISVTLVLFLRGNQSYSKQMLSSTLSFICLALVTFLVHNDFLKVVFFSIFTSILFYQVYLFFKNKNKEIFINKNLLFFCIIIIPVLATSLLLNLKRGPWAGVAISSVLLLILTKPRYALIPILLVLITITSFQPVANRISKSTEHFYIAGGRSTIWKIGTELSGRYPLGIGYSNSSFMRKFDKKIPPELRHFHSNFINIIVETGWIAFGIFIWWLYRIFKFSFRSIFSKKNYLELGIGSALLSWQIAGIGEYNFGDSEILFIVYLLVGMLASGDSS